MTMTSTHVLDVTDATFQTEVLDYSREIPVVVDFWAEWCGPCKTLTPVLETVAEECRGAFRLAKVDIDKNRQLAMAFRVQSIPMVVAIHQSAVLDHFMGVLPPADVRRFIDQVLARTGSKIPEGP